MVNSLIYLAVPYTHPDPKVREDRFNKINELAARLMKEGEFVFSPISHCHPIAKVGDLPKDWSYWNDYCVLMMKNCQKMIVLMVDGWKESIGVTEEIKIANERGIEVEYVDP